MYKLIGADGKEYGPVSAEVLRQWLAEGRVTAETRVLAENATEWKPLRDLPEFGFTAAGAPATIAPAIIVAPEQRRTNALAITGLILGIFSMTFGLCCCSGFPFSIAGLICSGIALGQIKQNPSQEGRGIAIAGLIISIIALGIGVLIMIFYGIMSSMPDVMRKIENL
jgi:hypothetical protein